ncbi:MAG TPA: hypothetical protein DHW64_05020, partial [Chitinophagaceae bacterium]|nr:hypothetical protein [Chitinophagaceae bacterium]
MVLFKIPDKLILMKTIQLIITALLVSSFCYAQTTYPSNHAIITGNILISPNDTIIVTYYPYKFGNTQVGGIVTKHANNDGSFLVEIPNMDHPYYFSIVSVKRGGVLLDNQLIEPGDSLMITSDMQAIQQGKNTNKPFFTISGYNADKNIAIQLFEFARFSNKISGLLLSMTDQYTSLREVLSVMQKNSERHMQYWDSLVTVNHFSISRKTKDYLLLDLEVLKINGVLTVYSGLYEKFAGNHSSETALQQLQTDYKEMVEPMLKNLISKYDFSTVSPTFLDMAFRKTFIDAKIQNNGEKIISGIKYLDAVQQWSTTWREEIITALMAYLYTYGYNVKNMPEMFPVLETMVNKPHLKSLIQNFEELYTPGKPISPFRLTDTNGEIINISNYKDKIVVLDFWFTGCNACIQMARILKIIKERLVDHKDIIFMSVSIDKKKESWLKSVAEEKYTHADFINVYTDGEGIDHPLIRRYNVTAYPRLIIISKNNKLATANPHIPRNFDEIDIL